MFGEQTYDEPLVGAVETGSPEYMVAAAEQYEPHEMEDMINRVRAVYEMRQAMDAYERALQQERLESYGSLIKDTATGAVATVGDVARTLVGKTGEAAEEAAYQAGNVGEAATETAGRTGSGTVDAVGDISDAAIENWYDTQVERERGRQRLDDVAAERAS